MLTVRKSNDRGATKTGWLNSRHTFSFGEYRDSEHLNFGALRVINEDIVAAGAGFQPHQHRDMEIVTYVLEGNLQHTDSLGTGSIIRPGEIQRMSAGSGITHSEFNASKKDLVHFFQIWIVPSSQNIAPSYEQKTIDPQAIKNKFSRIASFEPRESEVRLMQDMEIWAVRFDGEEEGCHVLQPGRRAWIQIARGSADVAGEHLDSGDAIAVSDVETILVRARGPAEILLFDLP